MTLTTEQKTILIDTCNVMINREATSGHSENLREVAKIALSTLTANREAAPVFWIRRMRLSGSVAITRDKSHAETWEREGLEVTPLYTAPPAPAVPDGYCIMPLTLTAANGAKGALSGEFKVSRTVRCHECGGEGCDDCGDAGEFEEETTVPWETIKDIYRAAVDACRAAMLAQPVSQRYKLVPVEPTEDMIAAAMNCDDVSFNADETFCVNFGNIYAAMLAAAPEASHDNS